MHLYTGCGFTYNRRAAVGRGHGTAAGAARSLPRHGPHPHWPSRLRTGGAHHGARQQGRAHRRRSVKLGQVTGLCPPAQVSGLAPYYLSELLQPYSPPRLLRSSNNRLLKEFRSRTKSYGDRAFKTAAPKLWNKLPLFIQQSKTLIF
jgi:hypothetical protein